MVQFYCLSVALCLFGALALLQSGEEGGQSAIFGSAGFKRGMAAAQGIAAVLLLASPYPAGKATPFFGDFFPMLACAALAASLFFDATESATIAESAPAVFAASHKKSVAFACAAIGILHFLVPQAAFF